MEYKTFKEYDIQIGSLLEDIKNGKVGLPDLQRPFVWKDAKVRDLLDSMMRGYPIGYIMTWGAPKDYAKTRAIGDNDKRFDEPKDLIIDGQQRLTSLIASMYGISVADARGVKRRITISYNPLTAKFEVRDAATVRSNNFINDIKDVFNADYEHTTPQLRRSLIERLNSKRERLGQPKLSEEEEDLVERNINRLLDLKKYTVHVIELTSDANEEDVAEIFRRVNSGGEQLREQNFIETVLAVYDSEMHKSIRDFCDKCLIPADGTAYNTIITANTTHIIRMCVGLGFGRARLKYAYMMLRGKDLKSGETSQETRGRNLRTFRQSFEEVTNLNDWHAYMNICKEAGYVRGGMILSNNAITYGYTLYLIGKHKFKVGSNELRSITRRWLFASIITSYYRSESDAERQLSDIENLERNPTEYVDYLDRTTKSVITDDFFGITIPNMLHTSNANSVAWMAYNASLIILGRQTLFSNSTLSSIMEVGSSGTKRSYDKHHIFPKEHLSRIGIKSMRQVNQVANFTYIDYMTNILIGCKPPREYYDYFTKSKGVEVCERSISDNAIPLGFETMEYHTFLNERRKLMASTIKEAYERLCENK